jgi:hypothetical protein
VLLQLIEEDRTHIYTIAREYRAWLIHRHFDLDFDCSG